MATKDSSELAVLDLNRSQATSLVLGALTAVMPDLSAEALTEGRITREDFAPVREIAA